MNNVANTVLDPYVRLKEMHNSAFALGVKTRRLNKGLYIIVYSQTYINLLNYCHFQCHCRGVSACPLPAASNATVLG